ncbi:unnamed protein product [Allacma fusca]|uniref:Uncharacterized protein n=1 Tax=Allacma fusca TaxID=39272 RepID=A0A8J2JU11_9HEXA|nr:unnamed protein product [Allacma fusca]
MFFRERNHLKILLLTILTSLEIGAAEDSNYRFFNETFDFPDEIEECSFNPDKLPTLFNNGKMVKCAGADLWERSEILAMALTTPPDDAFEVYSDVNRTFCPLWLSKGRTCFMDYLRDHCTKFGITRSQTNNALNFHLSFNDVFCNQGPGQEQFLELAKIGGLKCLNNVKKFQKPFTTCLNKADYVTDLLPIFLGYFLTCSEPLWKDCKTVSDSDREKLSGMFKILFKEMALHRRLFWLELLK